MTQIGIHNRLSASGAHRTGWLVSVGLHGSLVLGALLLLQHMQLAVMEEPFEWNVAMIQPAAAPQSPTTASESPPVPPTPKQSQVLAPRHPEPGPAQPLPPPVVPTPAPPLETHTTPPRAVPAPPLPTQATAPSKLEPAPEPIREEPRPQPPAPMKSPEAQPVTTPASMPTPTHSQPPPEPSSNASPSSTTTSTPEPTPTAPESVRTQVDTPAPMATHNRTTDASAAANPPAATTSTDVAALTPSNQSTTAKPDDGWLSALMGKWIADLEKHYPAALRLDGVQGKVVLVAILHENGTLSDVKIAKSSGNDLLDQAALADVKQGPPIKLSRPLGRPQRPIKFSISYDLKTVR